MGVGDYSSNSGVLGTISLVWFVVQSKAHRSSAGFHIGLGLPTALSVSPVARGKEWALYPFLLLLRDAPVSRDYPLNRNYLCTLHLHECAHMHTLTHPSTCVHCTCLSAHTRTHIAKYLCTLRLCKCKHSTYTHTHPSTCALCTFMSEQTVTYTPPWNKEYFFKDSGVQLHL